MSLIATSLTDAVRTANAWDYGHVNIFEAYLAATIGLLLTGQGKYTLEDVMRIHLPPDNRFATYNPWTSSLIKECKHAGTLAFSTGVYPALNRNDRFAHAQSMEHKSSVARRDDRCRFTLCTVENDVLNFDRLVNEGWFVFVCLPTHLLGDTIVSIIGNQLISQTMLAAMRRGFGGNPFRIIIDECGPYANGPLIKG